MPYLYYVCLYSTLQQSSSSTSLLGIMHWWFHQLREDVISLDPKCKESLHLPLGAQQLQESVVTLPDVQELVGIRSPVLSKRQKVSKVCIF